MTPYLTELRSDFFKSLFSSGWWWVTGSLNSQVPLVQNQLNFFDQIVHEIEISSEHNKKIMQTKKQKIINHINPKRKGPILSYKLRVSSLDEFLQAEPGGGSDLENAYAEYTNYVSILSEIKAYHQITKFDCLNNVMFLEETPNEKTPDLKGTDGEGDNVFVEVKCINPPKKEEQRMLANIVDFVEVSPNFMCAVNKKISEHLGDAKAKFESVGAYAPCSKRWVYININWGIEARLQNNNCVNLVDRDFLARLGNDLNIEVKFFNTF